MIDVSKVDRAKLAAEIKSISPEFSLIAVEGDQSGTAPSVKDIAAKFPDIGPLVRAYAESFGADVRDEELFEAGRKVGAYQYEKEWSFGSPLKMPIALRRTLVPALEAITKVEATDTEYDSRTVRFARARWRAAASSEASCGASWMRAP